MKVYRATIQYGWSDRIENTLIVVAPGIEKAAKDALRCAKSKCYSNPRVIELTELHEVNAIYK